MRIPRTNVLVCRDEQAVASEAAERFACAAVRSVAERGAFYVAIPGGSSPRGMFNLLVSSEFQGLIPWGRTELFFTDERCVPPESDQSNYRQANELLLSVVPIPEPNIHRFRGEDPPEVAAEGYEAELRRIMGDRPRFDLIILGMGADAHTASIFPGSPIINEREKLAAAVYVDKLDAYRLTLTLPVINNAETVIFIAMGKEKSAAFAEVLQGSENPELYPAQAVQPVSGRLLWIVDTAAALDL